MEDPSDSTEQQESDERRLYHSIRSCSQFFFDPILVHDTEAPTFLAHLDLRSSEDPYLPMRSVHVKGTVTDGEYDSAALLRELSFYETTQRNPDHLELVGILVRVRPSTTPQYYASQSDLYEYLSPMERETVEYVALVLEVSSPLPLIRHGDHTKPEVIVGVLKRFSAISLVVKRFHEAGHLHLNLQDNIRLTMSEDYTESFIKLSGFDKAVSTSRVDRFEVQQTLIEQTPDNVKRVLHGIALFPAPHLAGIDAFAFGVQFLTVLTSDAFVYPPLPFENLLSCILDNVEAEGFETESAHHCLVTFESEASSHYYLHAFCDTLVASYRCAHVAKQLKHIFVTAFTAIDRANHQALYMSDHEPEFETFHKFFSEAVLLATSEKNAATDRRSPLEKLPSFSRSAAGKFLHRIGQGIIHSSGSQRSLDSEGEPLLPSGPTLHGNDEVPILHSFSAVDEEGESSDFTSSDHPNSDIGGESNT